MIIEHKPPKTPISAHLCKSPAEAGPDAVLSVVQMLDGVIRLVGRELIAALAGELLTNGFWCHMHLLVVVFRIGKRVCIIVRLEMFRGILGCLRRELIPVFVGELFVDFLSAQVQYTRVVVCLGQGGRVFVRHA